MVRRLARRSPAIRTSTWCRSPVRRARASKWRATRPRPSSACTRNSVANRRTSSSPMPTSRAPSRRGLAAPAGVRGVMGNSAQSCNAPTRMLVPNSRMPEAIAIAKAAAEATTVGDPASGAHIGPVTSATQGDRIQRLINKGIEEGATVVAGGPGKPVGLETGYYVKPTVLANVNNRMTVAREEIFGPVLSILGYDTVDEAVAIGNDTPYGLAAYVSGTDPEATRKVAARLRAGQVNINSAAMDLMAPFGGFKQSGNGREWGDHAFGEFLEVKAVLGFAAQAA